MTKAELIRTIVEEFLQDGDLVDRLEGAMAASGKVIDGRAMQVQVFLPPQSDAGLPTDEVPGSLKALTTTKAGSDGSEREAPKAGTLGASWVWRFQAAALLRWVRCEPEGGRGRHKHSI
jgi:hypothetical protein